MSTHVIRQSVEANGVRIEKQASYSGAGVARIDGETAAGSGTTQFIIAVDVSAVQSFYLVSSVDCTLKTNSSGSPANTLALKAGIPYLWNTDSYDTFKLTTDVTSMYFVVAGATAATVYCEVLTDPTP